MGKSNRIRKDRANVTLSGVKSRKKSQGMPSWAINLITIAITALILVSVVLSIMSANGVFGRMQTALKSEHFRVDANMMNYYFRTQYDSFVQNNSSSLSYYGLDTGVSLKEQYIGGSEGEDAETWFDYIMGQTTMQVEDILVYCEEAYERGMELDDADKEYIDEQIAMYETYAQLYQYSNANSYLAAMYGKGMKEKDVRNAMELMTLASKCSEVIGEEVNDSILDSEIEAEYASNKLNYDRVDYHYYTLSVSYDDIVVDVLGKKDYKAEEVEAKSAEIIEKYKQEIEFTRINAELLKNAKTKDAFETAIAGYVVEDIYDEYYESYITSDDVATDELPSEEEIEAVRQALIAYITDIVIKGEKLDTAKVAVDNKVVGTDFAVNEKYAKVLVDYAEVVVEYANETIESAFVSGAKYSDTDEIIEWAFEEGRVAGDATTVEEGDGADGAEISTDITELKSFSITVAVLSRTQFKNEALSRNVAMMMFSDQEAAVAAAGALYSGITVEAFEEICNENGGQFSNYEGYVKGYMGVEAFDEWLYGEDVTVGGYTVDVLAISEEEYVVALYYGDGEAEWFVEAKNVIFTEKYDVVSAEISEKYTVVVKDSVIAKIDG